MPLIAKYRLTWRGSVVEPGTVVDALNPDEDRHLLELQRARFVVFVPEEDEAGILSALATAASNFSCSGTK